jgi:hypothetical protein
MRIIVGHVAWMDLDRDLRLTARSVKEMSHLRNVHALVI